MDAIDLALQGFFGPVWPVLWTLVKIVAIVLPVVLSVAYMTYAERRIIGYRPRFGFTLSSPRRKMVRTTSLEPTQIDDLYSELVCVAW